jgi:DNA-directed RNA polymerase beta' subunit
MERGEEPRSLTEAEWAEVIVLAYHALREILQNPEASQEARATAAVGVLQFAANVNALQSLASAGSRAVAGQGERRARKHYYGSS